MTSNCVGRSRRANRRGAGRMVVVALAQVLALGGAGCGGDDTNFPSASIGDVGGLPGRTVSDADFRNPSNDTGADAATDVSSETGEDTGGGGNETGADAPMLSITVAISKPSDGAVVPAQMKFTPEVDVSVDSPTGSASDTLKDVSAQVIDRASKKVVATGKLNQIGFHSVPETTRFVYNFADSPIDIAAAPSGNYNLVVTAMTNGGAEFSASQAFQIDAGPAIRINAPIADKAYKGSAPIDVTITDDYFGPVGNVQMKLGQTALTFAGPGGPFGAQYTTTLDFGSFMPALEGEQILTVRAKNKNGTESVLVRKFVSDSTGPLFANAKPKDGDLVGNVVNISVQVTDPAGVLGSSVVAVFANGPGTEYTVPLTSPAADDPMPIYSAVFDTRLLPFGENALFPTLSFRASDNLGNEALLTNVVWLDNRPPLGDLDPPDMRIWAKGENGILGCSWPFDPAGADSADDGDIVPQIVDVRARIEDQGNEPLSGTPNYIPLAAVDTAQLLILDDISQPLVVNSNPVAVGNRKADDVCDAINPLLIPTTRPMTSRDALLVTLAPITPAGVPDLSNGFDPFDQALKVGDERTIDGADAACPGGSNAKPPDSVCEVSRTYIKSRWRWHALTDWVAHSEVVTLFLGYAAGGTSTKLPSIWTIPKQESGALNPLCGGTQLDTLANFVNDGWACLALFSQDKLGNKQVSRPFRLCVDKDADGKECPHKAIARVNATTPLTVETVADHGLVTGDEVKVSGIAMRATVNGTWKVTVSGPRGFSLDGSSVITGAAVSGWVRPTVSVGGDPFVPGHVVKAASLPDCTGTQTATTPAVVVDGTKSCKPWRSYKRGEVRAY